MTTLTYTDIVKEFARILAADSYFVTNAATVQILYTLGQVPHQYNPFTSQNPAMTKHQLVLIERIGGNSASAIGGHLQIWEGDIRVLCYAHYITKDFHDARDAVQTLKAAVMKAVGDGAWKGIPRPQYMSEPESQPLENAAVAEATFRVKQAVSVL